MSVAVYGTEIHDPFEESRRRVLLQDVGKIYFLCLCRYFSEFRPSSIRYCIARCVSTKRVFREIKSFLDQGRIASAN